MTRRQRQELRRLRRVAWTGRLLLFVVLSVVAAVSGSPWVFAAALVGLLWGCWEQVHHEQRAHVLGVPATLEELDVRGRVLR